MRRVIPPPDSAFPELMDLGDQHVNLPRFSHRTKVSDWIALEAGFGRVGNVEHPTFPDLDVAQDWIAREVRVFASNGDDLTETDDEMKVAMRQIAGAFAQLEKARLVKKLRAARDRKRATGVKVEGRKSHAELNPELVRQAKRLRRRSPKGNQRSLREVSAALSQMGFKNASGRSFSASSIKAMVETEARRTKGFDATRAPSSAGRHPQVGLASCHSKSTGTQRYALPTRSAYPSPGKGRW